MKNPDYEKLLQTSVTSWNHGEKPDIVYSVDTETGQTMVQLPENLVETPRKTNADLAVQHEVYLDSIVPQPTKIIWQASRQDTPLDDIV